MPKMQGNKCTRDYYCYKCGLPLSRKAETVEKQVQTMIETLLVDPEVHQKLREKLLADGGLGSKAANH